MATSYCRSDFIGKRFGRLLVCSISHMHKRRGVFYNVTCDCGTEKAISRYDLKYGKTLSCGCLRRENFSKNRMETKKHGLRSNPLYIVWFGMMTRCHNPDAANYKNYGGRGIKVCERWHDVRNFISDMHPRPTGMQIDRIDNDGDYSPDNCRWADEETQKDNTSRNIKIVYRNNDCTIKELSRMTGKTYSKLYARIVTLKWDIERAISEP